MLQSSLSMQGCGVFLKNVFEIRNKKLYFVFDGVDRKFGDACCTIVFLHVVTSKQREEMETARRVMRERGAETEKMAEKQQKEVEDLSSSKLTCLENCRSQKKFKE